MISLIEHFLLNHNALVTSIEFLIEDTDLVCDINILLDKMKNNGAYWGVFKDRLTFLSRYDLCDIKKVSIIGRDGTGFLLDLQVNGVFVVSGNVYKSISDEICKVVRSVVA